LATTRSMLMGTALKSEEVLLDKAALLLLMERFRGKVAAAARHVGVTRPKLYRLLWAQGIKPESYRVARKVVFKMPSAFAIEHVRTRADQVELRIRGRLRLAEAGPLWSERRR